QPLGTREIARRERRSHGRARDALSVVGNIGHRFEREAVAAGGLLERSEVALALGAEAEVAPDEQPGHGEPTHQYVLDEMRRAHRRKARVEANEMHALDAGRLQELELVVQPRKARGRRIAGEKFARMRLECQYAGAHAQLAALGHHALDKRPMAAMHAVEVADGQRGAAPGAPQRAVRDHHGVVKMLIIDEMSAAPMKSLEAQMAAYAAYHQDARNKATHFIGVPLIVLSLFIPLAWLRVDIGGVAISAAMLFAAAVLVYYFMLDVAMALAMLVIFGLLIWLGERIAMLGAL